MVRRKPSGLAGLWARLSTARPRRSATQFARHGVRYLFIGKSGAILLGFPDTTQDADLFVDRSPENCRALVAAMRELGFDLTRRAGRGD